MDLSSGSSRQNRHSVPVMDRKKKRLSPKKRPSAAVGRPPVESSTTTDTDSEKAKARYVHRESLYIHIYYD